jgi:hypothetical protein
VRIIPGSGRLTSYISPPLAGRPACIRLTGITARPAFFLLSRSFVLTFTCFPLDTWYAERLDYMRVVINEALIARNRKISHILFFISLAGMGVGFFYTWTSPSSSSSISCLILPILLFLTLTSVRMANNWIREPRPVNVLGNALKGLGTKYTLFHHVLPAPHVLIGPEGIFTLTTFWQERQYRVEGNKWYGETGLAQRILGYMRQDLLGNPFQEALFHAHQVQRLVDKVAPESEIEVQPLIVFISPKVSLEIEDPIIPVLFADSKRKPSLRNYLRDQKPGDRETFSPEQLDEIDKLYGLITRQQLEMMGAEESDDAEEGFEDDAEDIESEAVEEAEPAAAAEKGTRTKAPTYVVYVFKAGQLYKIGTTMKNLLEDSLSAAQEETRFDVDIVYTLETDHPESVKEYLHRKFDRKRQKDDWFGLGKKDLDWLQEFDGELN